MLLVLTSTSTAIKSEVNYDDEGPIIADPEWPTINIIQGHEEEQQYLDEEQRLDIPTMISIPYEAHVPSSLYGEPTILPPLPATDEDYQYSANDIRPPEVREEVQRKWANYLERIPWLKVLYRNGNYHYLN